MSGTRYFSADEIADIKNARGCGVSWERLAGHFGVSVEELQQACGEPQWKDESQDRQRELPFDLFATDRLDNVL